MKLLARNQIKEAMPIAYGLMTEESHGRFWRKPGGLEALAYFGKAAAPHFDEMKQVRDNSHHPKASPAEIRNIGNIWKMVLENQDKDMDLKSIEAYLKKLHGKQ